MSIFREYDIRGIVGKDLTVELAEKIGRAYGSRAVRGGAKSIAVGRDGRTSAPVMREAVLKGLLGCGLDVVDIGVCPTPLLYFALFTLPVGGGVMITASHNPPEYNGFKLCLGKDSLHGAAIQSLEADIERGRFESGQGRVSEHAIIPDYLAYIEKGQILWGDKLMVLFSRDILKEKPGATIISEVKASQVFYDDVAKHGGRAIMWKTGHSVIKAKLKEERAALAGELSGHIFFADRYFGYDDAIYASCRLIEILAKAGRPLSTLLTDLPHTVSTPEIRVDCPDDVKFQVVEEAKKQLAREHKIIDIDGVRVLFPDGWGLIRASNTQPALVLRFEATSEAALKRIREIVESQVKQYVTGGSGGH